MLVPSCGTYQTGNRTRLFRLPATGLPRRRTRFSTTSGESARAVVGTKRLSGQRSAPAATDVGPALGIAAVTGHGHLQIGHRDELVQKRVQGRGDALGLRLRSSGNALAQRLRLVDQEDDAAADAAFRGWEEVGPFLQITVILAPLGCPC